MICPVCRTESHGKSKCSHCGFDQLNKEFISKEDYNYWVETVVNTCQNIYLTTKANALRNASYRELRNEINLRPPIDYLMEIEDAFRVHDYWVVVGVLRYDVSVNLKIGICELFTIDAESSRFRTPILKIEKNREFVQNAIPGDRVGLLLDLPSNFEVSQGMYVI